MISLAAVQQHARDLIAAHSYFTGKSVLVDTGGIDPDAHRALVDSGICVRVMIPEKATAVSQGGGKALLNAVLPIVVSIGQDWRTKLSLFEAVGAAASALLAYKSDSPKEAYTFDQDAMEYDVFDQGSVSMFLLFRKQVSIA